MSDSDSNPLSALVDLQRHPIADPRFAAQCRRQLDIAGALVLEQFFSGVTVENVISESLPRMDEAFFTTDTSHNIYLTAADANLPDDHPFNRQVTSTKGCLAHDQIPASSPLHTVYESTLFRQFLCRVLGIDSVYPYADTVSGINVHFHLDGQELGWHFDNSSFAITALMQAPDGGGGFEYVPDLRRADQGDMNFDGVEQVLNGDRSAVQTLAIGPGALVLFRGRDSMHRVTPSTGTTTRVLVVFAYNTEPGVGLSESAKLTFYGRSA